MLIINHLLQIRSRNKEPCMGKLLRLDEDFEGKRNTANLLFIYSEHSSAVSVTFNSTPGSI